MKLQDVSNLLQGMVPQVKPTTVYTVEGSNAKVQEVLNYPAPRTAPKPVVTPEEKIAPPQKGNAPAGLKVAALEDVLRSLTKGKDYGNIPNVPNPVLFKSGLLKIVSGIGAHKSETLVDKTVDAQAGLISYTVKVQVVSGDGEILAEAHGSASSLENKFKGKGFSAEALLVQMAAKRGLSAAVRELLDAR